MFNKIVEFEKPDVIWTWLHIEYYIDLAFALISPILDLLALPTQFSDNNLLHCILTFEFQRLNIMILLYPSPDSYRLTVV